MKRIIHSKIEKTKSVKIDEFERISSLLMRFVNLSGISEKE